MSDFTKIIRLDERTPQGEPTVQVLRREDLQHVKVASEALDYIKNVEPAKDKTFVIVLAVSSGELMSSNRNGDAFPTRPHPEFGITDKDLLQNHYKTFESAGIFKHHVNKDMGASLGRVVKAFFNPVMERVELLLEVDNLKAPEVIESINSGNAVSVSMGCKIQFDICNVCGNKAPTRKEYCTHAKYEMNRIYPDGTKSFVWNPSPRFFDISFVVRPADPVGFMLKKVAHEELELSADLGEKIADIQEKRSTLNKMSEIDKIIRGQVVDHSPKNQAVQSFVNTSLPSIMQHSPGLDRNAISTLSGVPLPEALSTLAGMGITPTCVEVTRIMINRSMPGHDLPPEVGAQMGQMSGGVLELFKQHPEVLESVLGSGLVDLDASKVNPQLAQKMASWMEKRSNWKEYLWRRVAVDEPHPEQGMWEAQNYADPVSGAKGVTTRGAINAADDASVERQVKTLAGAGLLTGTAYKVMSAHQGGRHLAPLAAAATALGGLTFAKKYRTPTVQGPAPFVSDAVTGEKWEGGMPVTTEMKMGSAAMMEAALPVVSSAAVTAMLAQEYDKRMQAGQVGQDPRFLQRTMDNVGQMAYRHPAATFLGGLAGIGLGAHHAHNLQRFIKGAEDSVKLASVDLDGLCLWLGEGLFDLANRQ